MIDRQLLRTNPDAVREGARRKRIEAPIDELVSVDAEWREATTLLESQEAASNRISKSIGALIGQGKEGEAEEARASAAKLKAELPRLQERERDLHMRMEHLELQIPNIPHPTSPDGKDSSENVEITSFGHKPAFDFDQLPHWDIAEKFDLLDFQRGTKIAGSGFIVFKGMGARLQRALINFMVDFHSKHHRYTEIYPPYLVNRESLIGTGQLPKFELDQYHMERDDLFLIATSEIPVTNLH
nr:serine--tRNA ligase [Armatimonadota bacterium]